MSHSLPARPTVEALKKQAKSLHRSHKKRDALCCETLRLLKRFDGRSDDDILASDLKLAEAQYALAMDYGFASWKRLLVMVDGGKSTKPPQYTIKFYTRTDEFPPAAEEMLEDLLKNSLSPIAVSSRGDADCEQWCVCAVTQDGHILGAARVDVGPISIGSLPAETMAFIRAIYVRSTYRRHWVAYDIMLQIIRAAEHAGCLHMRAVVKAEDRAVIGLLKYVGFKIPSLTCTAEGDHTAVRFLEPPDPLVSHCPSCSAPMMADWHHGAGDPDNDWCVRCCHPDGSHKTFDELIEMAMAWLQSDGCERMGFARANTDREARARAEQGYLKSPAWKGMK